MLPDTQEKGKQQKYQIQKPNSMKIGTKTIHNKDATQSHRNVRFISILSLFSGTPT
jgi:hypothetical protein